MNPDIRLYKIINIYHTGHHGPRGEEKIGDKYEERKNKVYKVSTAFRDPFWGGLRFKAAGSYSDIWTTGFLSEYDKGAYHYIETINSIYELEKVKNGREDL